MTAIARHMKTGRSTLYRALPSAAVLAATDNTQGLGKVAQGNDQLHRVAVPPPGLGTSVPG
ncbi:hypothetical protein [Frankia sp. Cr2]|uniref:hypothetical protein n=1 Tax=Frankia sp. Cr2 TaxID=3073932 RepID=UPI002AD45A97|nr:hypothetical protein [Frankia sp. Cr2]